MYIIRNLRVKSLQFFFFTFYVVQNISIFLAFFVFVTSHPYSQKMQSSTEEMFWFYFSNFE